MVSPTNVEHHPLVGNGVPVNTQQFNNQANVMLVLFVVGLAALAAMCYAIYFDREAYRTSFTPASCLVLGNATAESHDGHTTTYFVITNVLATVAGYDAFTAQTAESHTGEIPAEAYRTVNTVYSCYYDSTVQLTSAAIVWHIPAQDTAALVIAIFFTVLVVLFMVAILRGCAR